MTKDRLKEIEARLSEVDWSVDYRASDLQQDVPWLVSEVRRLRAALKDIAHGVFAGRDVESIALKALAGSE